MIQAISFQALAVCLFIAIGGTTFAMSNQTEQVVMETSLGNITLELDAEKAPATVQNFLQYVDDGFYDGTIFHRVIDNFMIQGGGFNDKMREQTTRAPIKNEADNQLPNDRYTIAMARTSDPHSATAQFFINTKNNDFLNHSAPDARGWGYAVFGKVIAGQDVVDEISNAQTKRHGGHADVPAEPIIIKTISRKTAS